MNFELTDVGLYSAAVILVLMFWKNFKESDKDLDFSDFLMANKGLVCAGALLVWGVWWKNSNGYGGVSFGQKDKLLSEPFWSPPAESAPVL